MKAYRINRARLKAWLSDNRMTQRDLARKIGCSDNGMSHALVNGYNSRMDLVLGISDATGLDVREIVEPADMLRKR